MSSRTSTPDSEDDLDGIYAAMAHSSPIRPPPRTSGAEKRTHSQMQDGDADEDVTASGPGPVNENVVAAARRYMDKKRLRGEQQTEVEVFMKKDPPGLREAKAYIQALHLDNMLTKIVVAAPPWQASTDLEKNIYTYATAILLSTKLSAYKGNIPKSILYAILKKHRFDLPPGIEHNPANWAKIIKIVQDAFTQLRAKFKKAIVASIQKSSKDKALRPKAERRNIFQLTQLMTEGTQCEVNVLLCARVAFMRKMFIKDPSADFWNTVDKELVTIRETANGDSTKITKAFRHILKRDQAKHGIKDYELDETVDTFQQEVDSIIEASATPGVAAAEAEAEAAGDLDEEE